MGSGDTGTICRNRLIDKMAEYHLNAMIRTSNPIGYHPQCAPGQFCTGPKITQMVAGRTAGEHVLLDSKHALLVTAETIKYLQQDMAAVFFQITKIFKLNMHETHVLWKIKKSVTQCDGYVVITIYTYCHIRGWVIRLNPIGWDTYYTIGIIIPSLCQLLRQ